MIDFSLHLATESSDVPTPEQFTKWIAAVFNPRAIVAEIGIRIVDSEESAELNQLYRHKVGPTNVLSFNLSEAHEMVGDIVICAPVMEQEAQEQRIELISHYAHITVHACYHLLGYDHLTDDEATAMEQLEIMTLAELGYANPYGDSSHV